MALVLTVLPSARAPKSEMTNRAGVLPPVWATAEAASTIAEIVQKSRRMSITPGRNIRASRAGGNVEPLRRIGMGRIERLVVFDDEAREIELVGANTFHDAFRQRAGSVSAVMCDVPASGEG